MATGYLDLKNTDFKEDKYSRLSLIPWWEQERISKARVMVVGAGAIGNELIKNLALLGIGHILVVDMDSIEHTNLTRSILYRASDVGSYKAETAANRAMEINPDIRVKAFVKNIIQEVGLGVFRRMDVILGGLDNREARLFINQCCWKVTKPYIDGAIEALSGFARVFLPPDTPCYECTMSEVDWKLINKRRSCALLTHEQMQEGKIPTTPTSSSVIAGVQVQEMLKLLHKDRDLPVLAGKCYVFNGMTHDSYVVEYQRKEDCMSHDTYSDITEMNWSVDTTPLREILHDIRSDLGDKASMVFDREIATTGQCTKGHHTNLFKPVNMLKGMDILCNCCGGEIRFSTTHSITGEEDFLDRTAGDIGLPRGHVVAGRLRMTYKHYEFTKDIPILLDGWL